MKDIYNILVIDDDPVILGTFQVILDDMENCKLYSACSFHQAKKIVDEEVINLVIVDIILPEIDGYEICKTLKEHPNASKAYYILMSSDKNHLLDRIKAYKVGAQEFITKPFDLMEVEHIIRSKIEYYLKTKDQDSDSNIITKGKFFIDDKTKKVMLGKHKIDLTLMEFNLLKYFIENPEQLLDFDKIVNVLWLNNVQPTNTDNVRHLINKLRNKIETDPKKPIYLVNSRRIGYIFYPSGAPTLF